MRAQSCLLLWGMEQTLAELLDSYSAALQQPQLGEESEQCSKKWRELKEAIEAAFSRKNDVIESLQRQLEMAQSESRSARDLAGGGSAWDLAGGGSARDLAGGGSAHDLAGGGSARDLTGGGATQDLAEGLQDELKEATQSLVQQPSSDTPEGGSAASQSGTGTRHDLERNGDQNVEEMESLNSHSVGTGPITLQQDSESQANATTINENAQMATNDISGTESSHAEAGMELSRAEAGISGSVHDPAGLQWIRRGSYPWTIVWVWLNSPLSPHPRQMLGSTSGWTTPSSTTTRPPATTTIQ